MHRLCHWIPDLQFSLIEVGDSGLKPFPVYLGVGDVVRLHAESKNKNKQKKQEKNM
jgi:hypothetical protein